MPHRCSIWFRSGDMLGQSITFTLSFFSKAVVVLEVCLGSLSCWNTALRPCLQREGNHALLQYVTEHVGSTHVDPDHDTPTTMPDCRQGHTCLCAPHLVAATRAWHHLNQISLSYFGLSCASSLEEASFWDDSHADQLMLCAAYGLSTDRLTPHSSTSAAMLAALIRGLFPKYNLWIWHWPRALNFFGWTWWGLF